LVIKIQDQQASSSQAEGFLSRIISRSDSSRINLAMDQPSTPKTVEILVINPNSSTAMTDGVKKLVADLGYSKVRMKNSSHFTSRISCSNHAAFSLSILSPRITNSVLVVWDLNNSLLSSPQF
jgi:hypothetical protein